MEDEKFERAVEALENGALPTLDELRANSVPVTDVEDAMGSGGPPNQRDRGRGVSALANLAARCGVDPVGSLAADLCETAICEAMPPEEIVATARACREAAEICYGKSSDAQLDKRIRELPVSPSGLRLRLLGVAEHLGATVGTALIGALADEAIEWLDEAIGFPLRREDLRETIQPPAEVLEGARAVVHGETDGIPYRAHFDGEPSVEQQAALDDLVRAVHADMTAKSDAAPVRQDFEVEGRTYTDINSTPRPSMRTPVPAWSGDGVGGVFEKPWPDPPTSEAGYDDGSGFPKGGE